MLGSGHLTGYFVDDRRAWSAGAGRAGAGWPTRPPSPRKYGLGRGTPPLLFAMGDGNHSLATAKAIWEQLKPQVGMDHPARYALVEIENIHDEGLEFEPIHRVLFGVTGDFVAALEAFYADRCHFVPCATRRAMVAWWTATARSGASTPSAS